MPSKQEILPLSFQVFPFLPAIYLLFFKQNCVRDLSIIAVSDSAAAIPSSITEV